MRAAGATQGAGPGVRATDEGTILEDQLGMMGTIRHMAGLMADMHSRLSTLGDQMTVMEKSLAQILKARGSSFQLVDISGQLLCRVGQRPVSPSIRRVGRRPVFEQLCRVGQRPV